MTEAFSAVLHTLREKRKSYLRWYIFLGYTSDLPHIFHKIYLAKVVCLSATDFTQSKILSALQGLNFVDEGAF